MVADVFKEYEPPSQTFLATPLWNLIENGAKLTVLALARP